ncbi:MAG: sensor domain-containing diguanylate cyclase [Clostridia bacterium]|jgi:diguanylate cyclase (GGDEF)-like protein|nr:sensor domain-containing diguanylate cyclase [Clostridia bacterium]
MSKILMYERKYTILHIALLILISFVSFGNEAINNNEVFTQILRVFWAYEVIKLVIINQDSQKVDKWLNYGKNYSIIKAIELIIYTFLYVYGGESFMWASIFYILIIMEVNIAKNKTGNIAHNVLYMFPMVYVLSLYYGQGAIETNNLKFYVLANFIALMIIDNVIGWTIHELEKEGSKNRELLLESKKKNNELVKIEKEMHDANQRLIEQKETLEKMNEKFRKSNAELYILKEMGSHMDYFLGIDPLLDLVVDMVLGIMGVDLCSIILYDKNENEQLKFYSKGIYDNGVIADFEREVIYGEVKDWIINKKFRVENNAKEKSYSFLKGRNVGSYIMVPLQKGDVIYGAMYVEHSYDNYFPEGSIQLFKVISAEVRMAIENVKLYKQMEDMATKDGLTKIYNRMYMQKEFSEMFKKARENKSNLAICIFDLDHFKNVNDTYGHLFGDKVLIETVNTAKKHVDKYNGLMARYGGEEFFVAFENKTIEESKQIFEDIRKDIEEHRFVEGEISMNVTSSFGVVNYPEVDIDFEKDFLKLADDALYYSKENGRNRVSIYSEIAEKIKHD